mgnify:CR=1 FL=1
MMELYGTLRIWNPKTLQVWLRDGRFQEKVEEGWIFSPGCGRFKKESCTCYRCRKILPTNKLVEILKQFNSL